METLVLDGGHINLPQRILRKFKGKQIRLVETDEGVLLSPIEDAIAEARGILKGSSFTSEKFFDQKKKDKELEL